MALTDPCDVFGSLAEGGINHVMQQRPSLFNHATAYFKNRPYDLCQPIAAHPDVQESGNPLFSEEAPLPVPGTDGALALDYCVQITALSAMGAALKREEGYKSGQR